jgi:hypothetical protein
MFECFIFYTKKCQCCLDSGSNHGCENGESMCIAYGTTSTTSSSTCGTHHDDYVKKIFFKWNT